MELTKTAIEKIEKAKEMERIENALKNAGFPIERVSDFGTFAYMIENGILEGRFITLKVVLTKEFNEETQKGFDISEAISEYELKVQKENNKKISKTNKK